MALAANAWTAATAGADCRGSQPVMHAVHPPRLRTLLINVCKCAGGMDGWRRKGRVGVGGGGAREGGNPMGEWGLGWQCKGFDPWPLSAPSSEAISWSREMDSRSNTPPPSPPLFSFLPLLQTHIHAHTHTHAHAHTHTHTHTRPLKQRWM